MKKNFRFFVLFFFLTLLIAYPAYLLLREVTPGGYVFGTLYKMFLYHWEFPLQYILLFCLFLALIATSLVNFSKTQLFTKYPVLLFGSTVLLTVFIASPFGGVMWTIHDMQPGYFPEGYKFWKAIFDGALGGLLIGWLILAISIPFNVIFLISSYFIWKKLIDYCGI